jgi:hypothetical protein
MSNSIIGDEFIEKLNFSSRVRALEHENLTLRVELNKYKLLCTELRGSFRENLHRMYCKWSIEMCDVEKELEKLSILEASLSNTVLKLQAMVKQTNEVNPENKAGVFLKELMLIECPISMVPMQEPFDLACGHVFEKTCINRCLRTDAKCPVCRCEIKGFNAGRSKAMQTVLQSFAVFRSLSERVFDSIRSEFLCSVAKTLLRDPVIVCGSKLVERESAGGKFKEIPRFLRDVHFLLKKVEN